MSAGRRAVWSPGSRDAKELGGDPFIDALMRVFGWQPAKSTEVVLDRETHLMACDAIVRFIPLIDQGVIDELEPSGRSLVQQQMEVRSGFSLLAQALRDHEVVRVWVRR